MFITTHQKKSCNDKTFVYHIGDTNRMDFLVSTEDATK